MPLPLIVPIVVLGGGALALALGAKKKTVPSVPAPPAAVPPTQLTWEQTVNKQYQDAMASTDLDFIGRAANWMNTYGNRPDLYAAMKQHYDDVYKAKAQKVAYEQQTGGPPSSDDLTKVYNTAMGSEMKDPAQLDWAAALLEANGRTQQANEVKTKATSIRIATGQAKATPSGVQPTVPTAPPPTVMVMPEETITARTPSDIPQPTATATPVSTTAPAPTPAVIPTAATPATPIPTPIQTAETQPQADPNGTIVLARELIEVQSQSGWKTALKANVQVWQSKMGLTADGLFGPKSALKMADEVGVLPLIRYWSKTGGTLTKQLGDYRTQLLAKAKILGQTPTTKPHAVALEQSAMHEQGQGYPATPSPLAPSDAADLMAKVTAAMQTIRSTA